MTSKTSRGYWFQIRPRNKFVMHWTDKACVVITTLVAFVIVLLG